MKERTTGTVLGVGEGGGSVKRGPSSTLLGFGFLSVLLAIVALVATFAESDKTTATTAQPQHEPTTDWEAITEAISDWPSSAPLQVLDEAIDDLRPVAGKSAYTLGETTVATTRTTLEEWMTLVLAEDTEGIGDLGQRGHTFTVPKNTRVRVVQLSEFQYQEEEETCAEVEILDGEYTGRLGLAFARRFVRGRPGDLRAQRLEKLVLGMYYRR